MDANCTTRRTFLKQASLGTAGFALAGGSLPLYAGDSASSISIVVEPDDTVAVAVPTQWAISQLAEALRARGVNVRAISRITDAAVREFVIVVASSKNLVAQQIIKSNGIMMPSAAEALVLAPGIVADRKVVLACANDPLGLVYAALELADRVTFAESAMSALNVSSALVEQPASRTRSICRSFQSELEDKPWFNDRAFWTQYLTMLVAQRVNPGSTCRLDAAITASPDATRRFIFFLLIHF